MNTDAWIILALIVLALFVTAFAAAAETVLTSISRLRAMAMLEDGVSKGRSFELFLSEPGTFLTAMIMLNTFAIVVAASLTSLLVVREFGTSFATLITILGSFALISLFQVVPKSLAALDPDRVAGWIATPVRVLNALLYPLTALARGISRLLSRAGGGQETRESPLVTEEELRLLVNVGEEEGIIEEDEREMIRGIFDLEDTTVRTIMVPRIDIAAVPVESTISDVTKIIIDLGYSRIPVYESSIDNIIGIVYAKDLFQYLLPLTRNTNSGIPPLREILRPPFFIPESKKVDTLLRELQVAKVHIAIVVDEYGGTAGLVTIEDLLEEIVGEIQDEYDREDAPINPLSLDTVSVGGRVSLDDVNEELDVSLAAEEYDSIGGLVLELHGQSPPVGTILNVTDKKGVQLQIEVLDSDARRVKRLKVTRLADAASTPVGNTNSTVYPEEDLTVPEQTSSPILSDQSAGIQEADELRNRTTTP